MLNIKKSNSFIVVVTVLGLANCGQYPRYPNPNAQTQTNANSALNLPSAPAEDSPSRTKSLGQNNTAIDKPAPTNVDETKKAETTETTKPLIPSGTPVAKNDIVRTNLTPFDLFRTGLNYAAAANQPVEVKPPVAAPVAKDVAKVVPADVSTTSANASTNIFLNNGAMKNTFESFKNSNADPAFSLPTYENLLSKPSITNDERDTLLQKYFSIIESNAPELRSTLSLEARTKSFMDLLSNPRVAEIIQFRSGKILPEIESLNPTLQKIVAPFAYGLSVSDKMSKPSMGKNVNNTISDTDFNKRLKIINSNSVTLMTVDFSTGKISSRDNRILIEFVKVYNSLREKNISDAIKFKVVGHTQKMAAGAAGPQALKDANQVIKALVAIDPNAFTNNWTVDSKGFSELLNSKNPADLKNRRVEIVVSTEGN